MELIFVDDMEEVLAIALRKEEDVYENQTKEDFPEIPTTPPVDSPAIVNELYCN